MAVIVRVGEAVRSIWIAKPGGINVQHYGVGMDTLGGLFGPPMVGYPVCRTGARTIRGILLRTVVYLLRILRTGRINGRQPTE